MNDIKMTHTTRQQMDSMMIHWHDCTPKNPSVNARISDLVFYLSQFKKKITLNSLTKARFFFVLGNWRSSSRNNKIWINVECDECNNISNKAGWIWVWLRLIIRHKGTECVDLNCFSLYPCLSLYLFGSFFPFANSSQYYLNAQIHLPTICNYVCLCMCFFWLNFFVCRSHSKLQWIFWVISSVCRRYGSP